MFLRIIRPGLVGDVREYLNFFFFLARIFLTGRGSCVICSRGSCVICNLVLAVCIFGVEQLAGPRRSLEVWDFFDAVHID